MLIQNYNGENSPSFYQGRFSYWKASLLALFLSFTSLLTGFFFSKAYFSDFLNFNLNSLWSGFLAFIIFLTFFLLNVFFVERKMFLMISILLAGLVFFIPFFPIINKRTIWGVIITTSLFLLAAFRGRQQLENFLRVKFFNVGNLVLSKVILALALAVTIFFFNYFFFQNFNHKSFLFSEDFFERMLNWLAKVFPLMSDLDFSLSLRELSFQLVNKQIKEQNFASHLVNPSVKKELVEKSIINLQNQFQSFLGISLNPEVKLSSAIYQAFLLKINNLDGKFKTIVSAILALFIFLTIQFISPLLRWFVLVFAFIVYHLLMIFGFGVVVFENQSKEKIVLP